MKDYGAYFHGFHRFVNFTAVYDAALFDLGCYRLLSSG